MSATDLELMLYNDGELDAESARRVRLARLGSLDVGTRLEGIERVGAFVRAWAAAERADVQELRLRALRSARRRRLVCTLALAAATLAVSVEPVTSSGALEVAARGEPGVAIEAVDFGASSGAVFLVETAASVTTVVWLSDDARADG